MSCPFAIFFGRPDLPWTWGLAWVCVLALGLALGLPPWTWGLPWVCVLALGLALGLPSWTWGLAWVCVLALGLALGLGLASALCFLCLLWSSVLTASLVRTHWSSLGGPHMKVLNEFPLVRASPGDA